MEIRIYISPFVLPSKGEEIAATTTATPPPPPPPQHDHLLTSIPFSSFPLIQQQRPPPPPPPDRVTTHNPKVLEKLGFAHLITKEMGGSTNNVLATAGGASERVQQLESKCKGEQVEEGV